MIYQMYSVHDVAVNLFMQPFFLRTDREALRAVGQALQDPAHPFAQHPEDYTLFSMGAFLEATGEFQLNDGGPRRMITLLQLKASMEK